MNSALPETGFKARQAEFSAYIRDPFNNPRPAGVSEQRMATYRELFFNNVESFLSSNFPVLRKIHNDPQWFELCQDFFSRHQCATPHFSEIPEEFLAYLQHERDAPDDYPFLLELAHYEWVEMAVSIAQEVVNAPSLSFLENLAQQTLSVSPLAWPLAYHYPVQNISPQFLPEQAPDQPTYLVVYRDTQDDVHFLVINALTFRLLQLLQQQAMSGEQCLQTLATEAGYEQPDGLMEAGMTILHELAEKTIITPVSV